MTKKPTDRSNASNKRTRTKPPALQAPNMLEVSEIQKSSEQPAILHPNRFDSIVTYANVAPHLLSAKILNHIVSGKPPCKCAPTGEDGQCLRFWLDEDGQYGRPPEGERVDCASCKATCR